MDKIVLKNMKFFAYHGVLPEEQLNGQNFYIDVEILTDLRLPGKTDILTDTINYDQIYNEVKHITENNKYKLIEKLGEMIAQHILEHHLKALEVTVRIRKPEVPINGILDFAEVELLRTRNDK